MNRNQKESAVSYVRENMSDAQATFLVNYQGADVASMQTLRRGLLEKSGRLKVTKARLMRIAAQEIEGADALAPHFKDQIGLVFAYDNVSGVAKHLVEFAKKHDSVEVISGFYEAQVLPKDQVEFFASLPPREVLLAQLAGTLQAPVGGLASLLNQLVVRLLYVLQRIAEKKES